MRLKLWEKNFLLTFTVYFLLLNLCFTMLCLFSFQQQYMDFTDACRKEAEQFFLLEPRIEENQIDEQRLKEIAERYGESGSYMKLSAGEKILIDSLPAGNAENYYCVDLRYEDCQLQYMKSKKGVYEEYNKLVAGALIADVLLGAIIGALLYFAMKKIYRPVSNIAHELRTPLTSILGYAQLMSLDLVSEEDKIVSARRIESEAQYMRDVVENLLTIDSISGYRVERKQQDFFAIIASFAEKYPTVRFENSLDTIMGEGTLIRMLITNLLENAVREDPECVFTANKYMIEISNKARDLVDSDARLLNEGKRLADNKIKGHGIGMELCTEIAMAHGWRLEYTLEKEVFKTTVYFV